MDSVTSRLAGGAALLVLVWIAVYWWWEPRTIDAPITGAALTDVVATEPAGAAPAVTELPDREPPPVAPAPQTPPRPAPVEPREAAPSLPRQAPGGPRVVAPQFRDYTVQAGDTFAVIARRVYGDARHAGAVARANPFVDPKRLRVGRVIRVPIDPENVQGVVVNEPAPGAVDGSDRGAPPAPPTPPAADGAREHVVGRGDTLSEIARRYYGTTTLADLIFQANRATLASPDDLALGQRLVIPARPR